MNQNNIIFIGVFLFFCFFNSCKQNLKEKSYDTFNNKISFLKRDSLQKIVQSQILEFSKNSQFNLVKIKFQRMFDNDYIEISTPANFIKDSILYGEKFEDRFIFVYKNNNDRIYNYFSEGKTVVPAEFEKYQLDKNNPFWDHPMSKIYKILNKDSIIPIKEKREFENLFINPEIKINEIRIR